jgi:hypothetical protein
VSSTANSAIFFFALALRVDRAGIDEVQPVGRQVVALIHGKLAHLIAGDLVELLRVAVAEEADAGGGEVLAQQLGVAADVVRRGHVELHVAHAAVHQRDRVFDQPVRGQRSQPRDALGRKAPARALERIARLVRAALEAEPADADEVVVAGDHLRASRAQQRDASVRVGVVADDVAHAEKPAHAAFIERRQHGLERFYVAVDIA